MRKILITIAAVMLTATAVTFMTACSSDEPTTPPTNSDGPIDSVANDSVNVDIQPALWDYYFDGDMRHDIDWLPETFFVSSLKENKTTKEFLESCGLPVEEVYRNGYGIPNGGYQEYDETYWTFFKVDDSEGSLRLDRIREMISDKEVYVSPVIHQDGPLPTYTWEEELHFVSRLFNMEAAEGQRVAFMNLYGEYGAYMKSSWQLKFTIWGPTDLTPIELSNLMRESGLVVSFTPLFNNCLKPPFYP